jgi:hypothetical protein
MFAGDLQYQSLFKFGESFRWLDAVCVEGHNVPFDSCCPYRRAVGMKAKQIPPVFPVKAAVIVESQA